MNALDAAGYAEDKGIEDGGNGILAAPFPQEFDPELFKLYMASWWAGFVERVKEEEFPNE